MLYQNFGQFDSNLPLGEAEVMDMGFIYALSGPLWTPMLVKVIEEISFTLRFFSSPTLKCLVSVSLQWKLRSYILITTLWFWGKQSRTTHREVVLVTVSCMKAENTCFRHHHVLVHIECSDSWFWMNEEYAKTSQHLNSLFHKALITCAERTCSFDTEVLLVIKSTLRTLLSGMGAGLCSIHWAQGWFWVAQAGIWQNAILFL